MRCTGPAPKTPAARARCLLQARPRAASRRWRSPWPSGSAASSSMPIPCRSIAICASSRRGPPPKRRRGCRTGSTAMSMPPRTIRSGAGARMCAPCWTRPRRAGALPILIGGTGLYFKALTQGLSAGAADAARNPRRGAGALRRRRRCGAARRTGSPRSGDGRAAQARRPDADRPRARSAGGDRSFARGLAPRRHAGDARSGSRR